MGGHGRRAWQVRALAAVVLLLGLTLSAGVGAWAADGSPEPGPSSPATIVLFHGDGCPHCAAEREFLAQLTAEHPEVVVETHEVWNDPAGRELLRATAEEMGFDPVGVPVTIVGDQVWIGFDDATAAAIAAAALTGAPEASATGPPREQSPTVDVPLLGEVDLAQTSLLGATLAIGFVDGVNPCSLWVLSLLLAMVLHRGSRGRVLLVGGTFLTVTALMYGLYMIALYGAASTLSAITLAGTWWLRILVAAVAGTFGVLQLKDGLGVQRGPSLSISPERRPALYARMRAIASPDRALAATIAGTVLLAVAVSLLETPCTAGLPLLWTTLLAEQGVGWAEGLPLFAVYLFVFLLDELAVFALAVITLRSTRLQDRHGRLLKVVAGSVLITLAATMLIAPSALTTVTGTLVVFGIAAALAAAAYASSSGRSNRPSEDSPSSSTSRITE